MKKVAKEILKSIRETPVSESKIRHKLPKAAEIAALTEGLRGILLFDYECDTACPEFCATCKDAEKKLVTMLDKVFYMLLNAVNSAMLCKDGRADASKISALCQQYLQNISDIRRVIVADIDAAYEGDPAADSKDLVALVYPGFFAVSVHRLSHMLLNMDVPMIPRLMSEYAHSKTGIDIHPGAK
jgi:serine O-acetyltransferase